MIIIKSEQIKNFEKSIISQSVNISVFHLEAFNEK